MFILSIFLTLSFAYSATLYEESWTAAKGFDTAGSTTQAIAVAEATMLAMGGYPAWDQTRYITWRFSAVACKYGTNGLATSDLNRMV